jgi:glycosyltransferase involved in cell wall biosynthesis
LSPFSWYLFQTSKPDEFGENEFQLIPTAKEVKISDRSRSLPVSICVCTYCRPNLLAGLLDSLALQTFSDPFEIIVVDNDAAGTAAETVEAAKKRYPKLDIRYAVEPQKGISFARNTAASLAAGDFLAWIDDDETAAENWLLALWTTRLRSNADGVFGPVISVYPQGSPLWVVRSGIFDRQRYPTGTRIEARDTRTGNAFVKADWFRMETPFDPRLANTGGEDYDFFVRIKNGGAWFAWCDEAEAYEVVPLERQRLMWILERRLRASTLYWRITSKSRAEMVIRAGAGGVACVLFGLAGIAVAPLGLHRAVRFWCRAMGGLARVVAISGLRWRGY